MLNQLEDDLPPGFEVEAAPAPVAALPAGFEVEVNPAEQGFVDRFIVNPLGRGKNNILDQALNVGGYLSGLRTPEETAAAILQDRREAQMYPMTPDDAAGLQEIAGADGFLSGLGAAARNLPVIPQVAVESLMTLPAVMAGAIGGGAAGSAAGSAVAGPVGAGVGAIGGGALGAGVASGSTEFLTSIADALQSRGIEPTEETLAMALRDEAFMADVYADAAKRGLIIGGVDALTAGAAGRVAGPVSRVTSGVAGPVASRTTGVAAEAGVQATGGMAGEAGAQVATEGQIKPGEVLLEGLAEVPGAAIEVPATYGAIKAGEKAGLPAGFEIESQPVVQTGTDQVGNGTDQVAPVPAAPVAGPGPVDPEPVQIQPEPQPQPQPQPQPAPEVQPNVAPEPVAPAPIAGPAPVDPAPEPVVGAPAQPAAPAPAPRTERVVTPDGEFETDVEFEVLEADALKSAEGDLQPRDRANRVGSDMQVQTMAARLDPLRLTNSRETDRGAPIIDETDTILSGNGRTAAILASMKLNPERYDAYKAELKRQGFNIEGMKAPILVRRARGITPENKRRFTTRSNSDGGLGLSPAERAGIEQDYVSDDMLAGFDADAEQGVAAGSNGGFVRSFLRNLPQNEQASFINKEGALTPLGASHIAGAIFARAYGDKSLIERFVEDEKDPAVRNALTGAAGAWARMRSKIGGDALDITKDLSDAISLMNRAKTAGMTLPNFLAQKDAFSQSSPRAEKVARLFFNASGNRMAAWRDVRDRLRSYAEQAERTTNASGDIFGGEGPDADTILDGIIAGIDRKSGGRPDPDPDPAGPSNVVPLTPKGNEGSELFAGSEVLSRGPKRGKKVAKSNAGGEGGALFDASPAVDEDVVPSRAPRGALAPKTEEISFTNRTSVFEDAWRVAGLDPDEGRLLPPMQRIQVLKRVLEQTFGFSVDVKNDLSVPDAVNQMLDAYRNVRFMMHALALPTEAVSLNGRLGLTLERYKGRYFGAYSPANRTIHMPGRSNSFAHEWAHALDHYLSQNVKKIDALLSQVTRAVGLDPTQGLEAAFVNLVHKMFFNEADLAVQMLRLEQEANATVKKGPNAGQPTQAALKAREQLERLATGATRIRVQPSAYRQNSVDYAPQAAGYFGSVHEMLARAFEAYVAQKVEVLGGSNEFITKGDQNYLGAADRRLAMTYPKDSERLAIFSALDDVMHHVRTQGILGTGPAAARPDDADILDPQHWNKLAAETNNDGLLASLKREFFAARNTMRRVWTSPKAALKSGVSTIALNAGISGETSVREGFQRVADVARGIFYSMRGVAKVLAKRQPKDAQPFFQFVIDKAMTDPGTGRANQTETYEEASERETLKAGNLVQNALKTNGLSDRLSEQDNADMRALLYGEPVKNAKPGVQKVAALLRRLMDEAWQRATSAGVDMGYVRNKGYLPRVLVKHRIERDRAGFLAKATEVYRLQFDLITKGLDPQEVVDFAIRVMARAEPMNSPTKDGSNAGLIKAVRTAIAAVSEAKNRKTTTPAEKAKAQADLLKARADLDQAVDDLKDAIRDPYAETSAEDWRTRILIGDSTTYDSHGPDTNFAKNRTLVPEADDILADFYDTDALNLTLSYIHHTSRRAAYVSRFGQTNGESRVDDILRRQDVQDAIKRNPSRFNHQTPDGRMNILRDLANPKVDNVLEMALREAEKAGANGEDTIKLREMVETLTGRSASGPMSQHWDTLAGWVYVLTYITLLPRAALTAVTEPITFMMRTGSFKNSMRTFGMYLGEAVRSAKTVKDRQALAEAIGIVSTPLHDTVLLNRLSGDFGHTVSGNVVMSRFFRANGLAQLTNAQRRATVAGGFFWMRDMARQLQDPKMDSVRKSIIRAEFRDLGVQNEHIDALADWLTQKSTMPTPDDIGSSAGALFASAVARLTDQTIQNPRRADKALAASTPLGRVAFSLMSFFYTFFRNVHQATALRVQRDYKLARDEGASVGLSAWEAGKNSTASFVGGFMLMWLGQFVVSAAREAIFNSEQWDEKEKEGKLGAWLAALALSRTGIFGPGDVALNSLTGLRYERDLANLAVGAGPSYVFSNMQNIVKGLPKTELWEGGPGTGLRNSDKTNTAEHTAFKSAYRLGLAPAASWAISAIPTAGPVGWALRYGALTTATSSTAADAFADSFVGESDSDKSGKNSKPGSLLSRGE